MRDFPPTVPDDERPDTRGPNRFLFWLMGTQADVIVTLTLLNVVWQLPGALNPYLFGRAIDAGIVSGDMTATLGWAGLLTLVVPLGGAGGIAGHTLAVRTWLIAQFGVQQRVSVAANRLGHVLNRRVPTGEVLSVSSSDSDVFGSTAETFSRMAGSVLTFAVICALMFTTSPLLGAVVLVVSPLLLFTAYPVMRPLNRAQTDERTENAELTSLATDIVAGLRILRGVGGERTFSDNYARQSQRVRALGVQVGTWQAVVDAISVLLSGLLLAGLVWLGSHEMIAGRLTIGSLIAFVGYAIYLLWPIQTMFEFAQKWITAVVSARKTIALLGQSSPWRPGEDEVGACPRLVDAVSGFVVEPGELTVVVSADPDAASALADRLGRYLPGTGNDSDEPAETKLKGRARRTARAERERLRAEAARADAERSARPWGVSADGVDYSLIDPASLRERVVVSDTGSMLFSGTLQEAIDPRGVHARVQAEAALVDACAEDVFDSLPGGWQGVLDERGRGLSGGQRQRVVLARALLADPEVLVLVEPTSAVDAHTEARIASRVADRRRGRTTVVMSASPLWLHHADTVALLADGREVARGAHAELLANPDYRMIVARGMGDDDE